MVIQTTRFGAVQLQSGDVIDFPEGILGFNDLRKFVLLDDPNDEIFAWLQSCEVAGDCCVEPPGALDDAHKRKLRETQEHPSGVWIDSGLPGPRHFAAPIVDGIRTSKLVALMCSENAFDSDHVLRGIIMAAGDFRRPIVAFQLDRTPPTDDFRDWLKLCPRIAVAGVKSETIRDEIARVFEFDAVPAAVVSS